MQGQELTLYIRKAETSNDSQATLAKLLGMLAHKEVKAEDIQAHYKHEHLPTFNAMVQSFGRGELFSCQKQNFTNWLNGKDWSRDEELAYSFKAIGESCGFNNRNSRTFWEIWGFVVRMIITNPHERKRKAEYMGENKLREAWAARCRHEKWMWMGEDATR